MTEFEDILNNAGLLEHMLEQSAAAMTDFPDVPLVKLEKIERFHRSAALTMMMAIMGDASNEPQIRVMCANCILVATQRPATYTYNVSAQEVDDEQEQAGSKD